MVIKSKIQKPSGEVYEVVYKDSDNALENSENTILEGVHGFCFYKESLVIVYSESKGYWSLPGGGIDPGETYEEALVRETLEETNMKVSYQNLLGYQDIQKEDKIIRQTRSFCVVEPLGDFVADPDGDITKIKLIEPEHMEKYVNWHEIGEHLLSRALESYNNFYTR